MSIHLNEQIFFIPKLDLQRNDFFGSQNFIFEKFAQEIS